jgi:hypothetical protein
VPAGGLWDGRSVSGGDATQNGAPPPPPPPPSGSPFGRFLTQPVFLVALLALMISLPVVALSLKGDGGDAASPPQSSVVGTWAGAVTGANADGHVAIQLDVRSDDDGTLTRRYESVTCRGTLRRRSTSGDEVTFDYVEQLHPRRCRQRSTVVLTPLADDMLRLRELRGGRVVTEAVLRPRGR